MKDIGINQHQSSQSRLINREPELVKKAGYKLTGIKKNQNFNETNKMKKAIFYRFWVKKEPAIN